MRQKRKIISQCSLPESTPHEFKVSIQESAWSVVLGYLVDIVKAIVAASIVAFIIGQTGNYAAENFVQSVVWFSLFGMGLALVRRSV